ncbi:Terpene synthase metal-binding domain protein-like protein [Leptotrombidium deliense]|uniref:Terpene synthase n=1 Tax=Leptotrombidium deliense TaxID=299467 RepID=A0A443SHY6_9ACAR|nr:Terpene synthase metal-binding domain protein-like protein [Leptotrombidium deliense]
MFSRKYNYSKVLIGYESNLHPDYEKINEEVYQWFIKYKLPLHSEDEEKHAREDVAKFVCMCYPETANKRAVLICKFMIHILIVDDLIERNVPSIFFDSLVNHGNENHDVIATLDKCYTATQTPLVASFADIWSQMKSLTNTAWQKRFAEGYIWWLKANGWERKNHKVNRVPSLMEFIEYRQFTGVVISLIQLSRDIFLPESVMTNFTLQKIFSVTGSIVCLVNDIYSFEKEEAEGDMGNLVAVMKHEYSISEQEAIKKATVFINNEIEKFKLLESILPTFEGETNENVKKIVHGCKHWITGNHDWGFESGRYTMSSLK